MNFVSSLLETIFQINEFTSSEKKNEVQKISNN